jgi:hypothetical protein
VTSLERFAELRAAIEHGGERDSVLRREGLSPAGWIQLQRRWLDALAREVAVGDSALAARYCRAFGAAHPAAPEDRVNAPAPPALSPEPVALPAMATAWEAPREEAAQTPSYLKSVVQAPTPADGWATPAPVVPKKQATVLAFEAPRAPVVPFREGAPTPLVATPPRPLEPAARIATGTALALDDARGPATPFHSDAAEPKQKPESPPGRIGSGTAWAPSTPSTPATPFQTADAESQGFSLARYAELVAARDEADADPTAVLARFDLTPLTGAQLDAYWQRRFSADGLLGLDFGRQLALSKKALNDRRAAQAAAPRGTGTLLGVETARHVIRVATAAEPQERSTPAPQAAPPLPDLTVDQYAWLVSTLRKSSPADLPAVLARVRLTPETRKELEQRWKQRMTAEPAVQQAFLAALARHLGENPR